MKVKMHSGCIGQEKVVIGELTPPAPSCRCKKQIEYTEADKLVKRGEASWVIVRTTPVEVDVNCPLCASMSDTEKKTCAQCGGKGKIVEIKQKPDYNNDIVLLSSKSVDPKNKRYRWNMGAKTPRVPTIEAKHISRAIVDNLIYAVKRIKEYASMIQEALAWFGPENRCRLGAQLRDGNTGEIIEQGFSEPPDDWYTQTGRKWDMGLMASRTISESSIIGQADDELILDRPPYPDPKLATGGGVGDKTGNVDALQAYSLKKIAEGDFEICGNKIIAAGMSWNPEDSRAAGALSYFMAGDK